MLVWFIRGRYILGYVKSNLNYVFKNGIDWF